MRRITSSACAHIASSRPGLSALFTFQAAASWTGAAGKGAQLHESHSNRASRAASVSRGVKPRRRAHSSAPNSFTSGRTSTASLPSRIATAAPSALTHTSGAGGRGAHKIASANGKPAQRSGPRHRQTKSRPKKLTGSTQSGALGTTTWAIGAAAAQAATWLIIPIAQPATASGHLPSPKGVSAAPSARPGIIRNEEIGAAARLANKPQVETRLKCWMANGPVASPATKLTAMLAAVQLTAPCAQRIGQGTSISFTGRGQISASATRAAVAANDIWKPGSVTASGCSSNTAIAARASACRLIAWRSASTAAKATDAVIAARSAGGGAPDNTR